MDSQDKRIEPIKQAIMLEMHGLRFYNVAAEKCTSKGAKEIFEDLAQDEVRHKAELERVYKSILKDGTWTQPEPQEGAGLEFKSPVIDQSMKENIDGAWFDSAALNIGVMLEKRAMDYYREQQKASDDPEIQALFAWLADWERGHLDRLMALERAMREEIWHEAGFWPLD